MTLSYSSDLQIDKVWYFTPDSCGARERPHAYPCANASEPARSTKGQGNSWVTERVTAHRENEFLLQAVVLQITKTGNVSINVALRRVHLTIIALEKQQLLRTLSVCVCVALVIQHAKRMLRIIFSSVTYMTLKYFRGGGGKEGPCWI
jgi:hypothetical protein